MTVLILGGTLFLGRLVEAALASAAVPTGVKFGVEVLPVGLEPGREAKALEAWKARA